MILLFTGPPATAEFVAVLVFAEIPTGEDGPLEVDGENLLVPVDVVARPPGEGGGQEPDAR